jgi:hypothetical protein
VQPIKICFFSISFLRIAFIDQLHLVPSGGDSGLCRTHTCRMIEIARGECLHFDVILKMATPPDDNRILQDENILYDLSVTAEWHQESENLVSISCRYSLTSKYRKNWW